MVYSPNKVVACIKVDGKILREDKNVVTLPFGSEYSIFVKNLNATRIQFRVSVDGTDATEGVWLVCDPNSEIELERFIRGGNIEKGNRFKFIERTAEIEAHRGVKADDGLIRIEYQVEKPKPIVREIIDKHIPDWDWVDTYPPYPPRPYRPRPIWMGDGVYKSADMKVGPLRSASARGPQAKRRRTGPGGSSVRTMGFEASEASADNVGYYSYEFPQNANKNDQGITVAGSESDQKFRWTSGFETGPSEVIVLQLRGVVAGKKAVKAVTVKTRFQCSTCGKSQKSTAKFCVKCGTALEII